MKKINYSNINKEYLTEEIVAMLNTIHEYKGKEQVIINIKKDVLDTLVEVAKIQSIVSSNRIEGIFTTDERIKELVKYNDKPKNKDEKEIAGYREVLKLIHENHDNIELTPNYILQLHKELFSFSDEHYGGKYKNIQNYIASTNSDGNKSVLFEPVSPHLTPKFMEELCSEYDNYIRDNKNFDLILIPIFIVDFLCIHPFNDGNGRMSRLLILLLLYKNNFNVGKYISIEKIIENTKKIYYDTLYDSDQGWHDNKNTYEPFIKYFLGVIIKAYRELDKRIGEVGLTKITKETRVTSYILSRMGKITKKEIMEECPDISMTSIERTLAKLTKNEKIIKHSSGRNTYYTVDWDNK